LHRLNADILFLGVDGFDVHYGLSTPNLLEAKVNRAMMDVARVVVAVCDSSKFGKRSLSSIAPISEIDHLICDRGIAKTELAVIKKAGVQVTLV
jgi:DeoR family transcriptional regulator, aga operon transcriptional repressor